MSDAGNSLFSAVMVSDDYYRTESVGFLGDSADYYKIQSSSSGIVNISLTNLSGDIDILLYSASSGLLEYSANYGNSSEYISYNISGGQNYYLSVYPYENNQSNYSLYIDLPEENISVVDSVGNNQSSSTLINGDVRYSEAIGYGNDNYDYFEFIAPTTGVVDINLSGLSSDIDLELYNNSGTKVDQSTRGGSSSENISMEVVGGETYYIGITPWNNNQSNYIIEVDLPSAVWWSTRDLSFSGSANHHFLRIEGADLEYSSGYIEDLGGGHSGFTIGATTEEGELTAYRNNSEDLVAIKEETENSDSWFTYDIENYLLTPPEGVSNDEFIEDIVLAYEAYVYNSNNRPIDYAFYGDLKCTENVTGNCATWLNSILTYLGVPEESIDNMGDVFNGIDWGEDDLIDLRYFETNPIW